MADAPVDQCSFFLPISKIDKEQRMVWGYASTPTKDLDGEVVALEAIKSALPEYMEWGNIREMHQSSAVGVAKEANVDSTGLYLGAKIVDDDAWNKVVEGVYKGFSIGGRKLAKTRDTITSLELIEISVVDRPANPDCRIEVIKSAKPIEGGAAELMKGAGLPPIPNVTADPAETLVLDRAEVGVLGRLFGKMFRTDPEPIIVEKRDVSDKERADLADEGHAMPDGSYPIKGVRDLQNAVQAFGRAKDPEGVKRHITRQAKRLDRTDLLPADWAGSTKEKEAAAPTLLGSTTLDVQKGMRVVAMLADAFESIRWAQRALLQEDAAEGDGEDKLLADSLGAIAASLAGVIGDKAHHEGGEARDLSDVDDLNFAQWTGVELAMSATIGKETLAKRMSAASKGAMGKVANHFGKALEHHAAMGAACDKLAAMHKADAKKAADAGFHEEAMSVLHDVAGHHEAMGDHLELAAHHLSKVSGSGSEGDGEGAGGGSGDNWGGMTRKPFARPGAPDYSATDPYPGKAAQAAGDVITKGEMEARVEAARLEGELNALRRMPAGAVKANMFVPPAGAPPSDPRAQRVSKILEGVQSLSPGSETDAEGTAAIMIQNVLSKKNASTFQRSLVDADYNGSIGRS